MSYTLYIFDKDITTCQIVQDSMHRSMFHHPSEGASSSMKSYLEMICWMGTTNVLLDQT